MRNPGQQARRHGRSRRSVPRRHHIGLRNLTGAVSRDGSVTLRGTSWTSSASADNGADPNKVVRITDDLAATTMIDRVARESFRTVGAELRHGAPRRRLRER